MTSGEKINEQDIAEVFEAFPSGISYRDIPDHYKGGGNTK